MGCQTLFRSGSDFSREVYRKLIAGAHLTSIQIYSWLSLAFTPQQILHQQHLRPSPHSTRVSLHYQIWKAFVHQPQFVGFVEKQG